MNFICKTCGAQFESKAHNALYCPECRKKKQHSKATAAKVEKKDLLSEAEQNVLNHVREAQDWIKLLRLITYAGYSFFPDSEDPLAAMWVEGIKKAERALFSRLCFYQAEAFMFTGIGGEKALKFAKEKFLKRFNLDESQDIPYEVMYLLDEKLSPFSSYFCDVEAAFRKQAKEKYESNK